MKSAFAVALLSSTFALAAWDANWGQVANDEVPAADLTSNAASWTGPSATANSGKQYASGGETSWKVTQEGDDNQELVIFMTMHVTVDGTAGIGDDIATLMTCIPNLNVPATELRCIVQRHAKVLGEEELTSDISTFYWDENTAFPVEQLGTNLSDWIPLSCVGQQVCPWELVTSAQIRQPGVEASDKRWQYDPQGYLVTGGFYGASTMKAIFKTKNEIVDDDAKAKLNRFKAGSSIAGKQYLQLTQIQDQQDLELQAFAVDIKYKAESGAGEDDSAMSFGAAVGAVAVAISALAF